MRFRASLSLLLVLALAAPVGGLLPSAQAKGVVVHIEMRAPNRFSPNIIQVDPGDQVTIFIYNNDTTGHTFDQNDYNIHLGTRASPLQPGENQTATFTTDQQGDFWFFCDVLGHSTPRGDGGYQGMAGRLVVGQAQPGPDLVLLATIGGAVAAAVAVAVVFVWWYLRRQKA